MKNILLILTILFFVGCASSTNSGAVGVDRKQFFMIGSDEINKSANLAYTKTLNKAKNEKSLNINANQTKRVRKIAKNLISQVGIFRKDALKWDWQVNVIDSDEMNAWCMPGGKIVVYSGIIKKLNLTDAELAAIMGHEMAHALREHSREQMSADTLRNLGILAVGIATGNNVANVANLASNVLFTLPFSRQHETESDTIGTELMARAGYDPKAAVEVWKKMDKISKNRSIELLSTHPSHKSRIENLEKISEIVMPLYKNSLKQK